MSKGMYEMTGYITSTRYVERLNAYYYQIKNTTSKATASYAYYCDNTGNSPDGINDLYEITITYTTTEKNGNTYNTIKSVKYGEPVKNMQTINGLLKKVIQFTETFAKKIVDAHGKNTIEILLEKPEEIKKIKHRTIKTEWKKMEGFMKNQEKFRMHAFLSNNGIGVNYHEMIISHYESNLERLQRDIYEMCEYCKVPFNICDKLALENKYDFNDPRRISAFVYYLYKIKNGNALMYLTYFQIEKECNEHKKISIKTVLKDLVQIEYNNKMYYISPELFEIEEETKNICNILRKKLPIIESDFDETDEDYILLRDAINGADPSQDKGKGNALRNSLSIITGGAGTGKTYAIASISTELLQKGKALIYALAPTGAAVERIKTHEKMLKMIGNDKVIAKTIHSFLYMNEKKNFSVSCTCDREEYECVCKDKRLIDIYAKYDEIIFFIDEMSMVGLKLFYRFLKSVEFTIGKIKLILLGDHNQLPSIDGGNVLCDLINSKKIKCTILTRPHRQQNGNNSSIYMNSELVLKGQDMVFNDVDFKFIETTYEMTMCAMKTMLKGEKISHKNSCIITPKKTVGICVQVINEKAQKYYNANGEKIPGSDLRVDDKVMQNVNNKQKGVFNGSILVIDSFIDNKEEKYVKCGYYNDDNKMNGEYDKTITYSMKELTELDLSYSFSVHKSQGKGYDNVILFIHSSMGKILNKNLLYTAITRAKKKCIIIGDKEGLEMCKRDMPERVTNLFKNNFVKSNECCTTKQLHKQSVVKPLREMCLWKLNDSNVMII
jgi:exodeoxyribonuclease V alpha subunit